MQQISTLSGNFQLVHNSGIELGDNIKVILNSEWRQYEITEIIESRPARGQHKDPKATWFNIKSVQVPLTDG